MKERPLAERLERCRALGELAEARLSGIWDGGLRLLEPCDGLLLGMFGRLASTFRSLIVLSEKGYGEQAAMLDRALYEGMVDAYWFTVEPERAQARAEQHYIYTRVVVAEAHNCNPPPGQPAMAIKPADLTAKEQIDRENLFGRYGELSWTGEPLHRRLKVIQEVFPEDYPGQLSASYAQHNRLPILAMHGAPMAINDRFVDVPGGQAVLAGPSGQHLGPALRTGFWCYSKLVHLLLRRWEPGGLVELTALYDHGWPDFQAITTESMRRAGRNGLCPCGSGRKLKRCHDR
jgi:uncharacterized protein DUF5677/SEC-C motif-containing protein